MYILYKYKYRYICRFVYIYIITCIYIYNYMYIYIMTCIYIYRIMSTSIQILLKCVLRHLERMKSFLHEICPPPLISSGSWFHFKIPSRRRKQYLKKKTLVPFVQSVISFSPNAELYHGLPQKKPWVFRFRRFSGSDMFKLSWQRNPQPFGLVTSWKINQGFKVFTCHHAGPYLTPSCLDLPSGYLT